MITIVDLFRAGFYTASFLTGWAFTSGDALAGVVAFISAMVISTYYEDACRR